MTRVTSRMLEAHSYFVAAGMHEKGASAPIGNFVQESGENLDSTMFRVHADHDSGGIAEWRLDRKTGYLAFSKEAESRQGLPPGALQDDLKTQCDFCVRELTSDTRYWSLYQQLTTDTGRSIATLTANFMETYERPALATAGLNNRIEHAEALYDRVQLIKNAGQAPTVPVTSPPPPVPSLPLPSLPTAPAGLPPISASTAGRQAAVRDMLDAMRVNYVAELESIKNEIAIIDETIADFGKLSPVPAIATKLLTSQVKAAIPVAIASQPRSQTVFGITNWRTALTGIIAALAGVAKVVPALQPYSDILTTIGLIAAGATGMVAKDQNVTGGTISAATGIQTLRPVSVVDEQPASLKK